MGKPVSAFDEENIWTLPQLKRKCYAYGWGAPWSGTLYVNRKQKQTYNPAWKLTKIALDLLDDWSTKCVELAQGHLKYNIDQNFRRYHRCAVYERGYQGYYGRKRASFFGPVSGDMGGPLICPSKPEEEAYVFTGVHSFSFVNVNYWNANLYVVYAPVHIYINWIQDVMNRGDKKDAQPEHLMFLKQRVGSNSSEFGESDRGARMSPTSSLYITILMYSLK